MLLWLLAGFLLLADLSMDPPGDVDHSAGIIFDPPSKCQAARNHVLFGTWRTDEWTPYLHGALHTLVQAGLFRLAGVNLTTMRLPGAVMLWAALLFFAALASRGRDVPAAALVLLAGGINRVMLAYGRSGLLEPQLVFWVALSAWSLDRAWRQPEREADHAGPWLFLSGCAAVAAFWTKGTAATFLLAAAAVVLVRPPGRRRNAWWFFLPLAAGLAVYAGPFWWHNRVFFEREASYWMDRAARSGLWERWSRQPVFHQLGRLRWILALALLAVPLPWRRYRDPRAIPAGLRVLGLALVAGLLAVGFMDYRPLRYAFPVFAMALPLAVWLTFRSIEWIRRLGDEDVLPAARRDRILWAVGWMVITYALTFSVFYPWSRFWPFLSRNGRLAAAAATGFCILAGLRFFRGRLRAACARVPCRMRVGLLSAAWGLAWLVIAWGQANEIRTGIKQREHQMFHFSRRLGTDYRALMVAGSSPAFAVMENHHRARKVTPYGINLPVLSDPALSHLLIPAVWGHWRFYANEYPEVWARAEPVERIEISGVPHVLYALDRRAPRVYVAGEGVVVENPDDHTPVWICLARPDDLPRGISGVSRLLLPGQRESFEGFPEDAWFLTRDVWQRPGSPADSLRARKQADARAWDQWAWAVGRTRRRRGPVREGQAAWTVEREAPIRMLGLRLRGQPRHLSDVHIRWEPDGGSAIGLELPLPALDPSCYETFFWPLPERSRAARGRIEISVTGESAMWVDAFLLSTEQDLDNARLRSEPAGPPGDPPAGGV